MGHGFFSENSSLWKYHNQPRGVNGIPEASRCNLGICWTPNKVRSTKTGWWLQICFIFTPIWGRFPFWLQMGWNHQLEKFGLVLSRLVLFFIQKHLFSDLCFVQRHHFWPQKVLFSSDAILSMFIDVEVRCIHGFSIEFPDLGDLIFGINSKLFFSNPEEQGATLAHSKTLEVKPIMKRIVSWNTVTLTWRIIPI